MLEDLAMIDITIEDFGVFDEISVKDSQSLFSCAESLHQIPEKSLSRLDGIIIKTYSMLKLKPFTEQFLELLMQVYKERKKDFGWSCDTVLSNSPKSLSVLSILAKSASFLRVKGFEFYTLNRKFITSPSFTT